MPRPSLRTWILLPAMALVAGLIVALSVVETDTLVRAWLKSSEQMAELAGQQIKQTLLRRINELPRAASPDIKQTKASWAAFIRTDPVITASLESSTARGGAIVEISIADESGIVMASSDAARPGQPAVERETLRSLLGSDPLLRFRRVFSRGRDYEYSIPIGLAGESRPVFTIQVLVSNVLLRDALGPGMRRIALVSAAALVLSLAVVYAIAGFTTSNLKRLGAIIDRIAGAEATPQPTDFPAAEFAAVGSKLSLLDDRVRGALQDADQYRQRVNSMLERLREAILLLDGDRLVLAAGAITPLLGYRVDQIAGRRYNEILGRDRGLAETIENAFAFRQPVRDQVVPWTVAGRTRELLVNLDFIADGSDARPMALLRLRDAQGAGDVESQLELSSRLEAINRLTGGMAHEIKNPLNAIAARLALLESIVVEEAPDAEQQIHIIAQEIERLDRVVRTFLDFTRPLEIKRECFDMVSVARDVGELLTPDAARRGIAVRLDTVVGSTLPARGDRDMIKQAIMNIAVNAIEAMTSGGVLTIRAADDAGFARLSIADTGPGIAEPHLKKIFQLYFTTKEHGSGIGLAIAYRTVQLHGGELSVDSEPGKGSTFHLALPMLRMEEPVEQSSVNGVAAGAGVSG